MIIGEIKIELESILFKVIEPENYSVQDASKLLDCAELTIYNYIKKELIPASKIGQLIVIIQDKFPTFISL